MSDYPKWNPSFFTLGRVASIIGVGTVLLLSSLTFSKLYLTRSAKQWAILSQSKIDGVERDKFLKEILDFKIDLQAWLLVEEIHPFKRPQWLLEQRDQLVEKAKRLGKDVQIANELDEIKRKLDYQLDSEKGTFEFPVEDKIVLETEVFKLLSILDTPDPISEPEVNLATLAGDHFRTEKILIRNAINETKEAIYSALLARRSLECLYDDFLLLKHVLFKEFGNLKILQYTQGILGIFFVNTSRKLLEKIFLQCKVNLLDETDVFALENAFEFNKHEIGYYYQMSNYPITTDEEMKIMFGKAIMDLLYADLKFLKSVPLGIKIFRMFRIARNVDFFPKLWSTYSFLDLDNEEQIHRFVEILSGECPQDFKNQPTIENFMQLVAHRLASFPNAYFFNFFITYFDFLERFSLEKMSLESELAFLKNYSRMRYFLELQGSGFLKHAYNFDEFLFFYYGILGRTTERAIKDFKNIVDPFFKLPEITNEKINEFKSLLKTVSESLRSYLNAHFRLSMTFLTRDEDYIKRLLQVFEAGLCYIDSKQVEKNEKSPEIFLVKNKESSKGLDHIVVEDTSSEKLVVKDEDLKKDVEREVSEVSKFISILTEEGVFDVEITQEPSKFVEKEKLSEITEQARKLVYDLLSRQASPVTMKEGFMEFKKSVENEFNDPKIFQELKEILPGLFEDVSGGLIEETCKKYVGQLMEMAKNDNIDLVVSFESIESKLIYLYPIFTSKSVSNIEIKAVLSKKIGKRLHKGLTRLRTLEEGENIFKIFNIARKIGFPPELSRNYNFLDFNNEAQIKKFLKVLLFSGTPKTFRSKPTKFNFISLVANELITIRPSQIFFEFFIHYFSFLVDYPSLEVTDFDSDFELLGAYVALRSYLCLHCGAAAHSLDIFSKRLFDSDDMAEKLTQLFSEMINSFLGIPELTDQQIKGLSLHLKNLSRCLNLFIEAPPKSKTISIFEDRSRLQLLVQVIIKGFDQIYGFELQKFVDSFEDVEAKEIKAYYPISE